MKELFKNKYRIETTRLKNWDYSSNGIYYITICTRNREKYLGDITNGKMQLSEIGEIAYNYWAEISNHYPMAIIDEFVVMPNHVHGIIIIKHPDTINDNEHNGAINEKRVHHVETQNFASLQKNPTRKKYTPNKFGPQSKNIPAIIRGYKSAVKKYATMNKIDFAWHPRYHDRIIRSQKELKNVQEYIRNNPMNWNSDKNNI